MPRGPSPEPLRAAAAPSGLQGAAVHLAAAGADRA